MPRARSARKPHNAGNPYTVGFIIDWTDSAYHTSLLRGVRDAAQQLNLSLLTFVGGALSSPRPHEGPKNAVYDYVNATTVDGIIIAAGSVGAYLTVDDLNIYCHRFAPLPIVSIAQKLEVTSSVLSDNKVGFQAAVTHLINHHGAKRIAMIRGPDSNQEAVDRFDAYRDTLQKFGLDFDPSLTVAGDFIEASGRTGATALAHLHRHEIDAIVAANDDMAVGAINGLRELGIAVPTDIAVVGFDDQSLSRYLSPPLTTVRQPLYSQGFEAVRVLHAILHGDGVDNRIVLPTELVIRQSCGCMTGAFTEAEICLPRLCSVSEINTDVDRDLYFKQMAGDLRRELMAQGMDFSGDIYEVIAVFYRCVIERNNSEMLRLVDRTHYSQADISQQYAEVWRKVAVGARRIVTETLSDADDRAYANLLLDYVLVLLFAYSEKALLFDRVRSDQSTVRITDMNDQLNACVSMVDIVQFLVGEFPSLKIRSCYFSLFEDTPRDAATDNSSRLVLAYSHGEKIDLDAEQSLFPRTKLLPDGIIDKSRRWESVVELVFFGSIYLGLVLLDFEEAPGVAFTEMRRVFLRIVLKNVVQMQRMASQSSSLKWVNDELYEALDTLKETQKKLTQSEKLSALGGLVAGISHEINTPIGVSVTASSHLEKVTKDFASLCATGSLKRSDLDKYVKTATEASEMILTNLRRSHELIRSFKQVAVDQSTEEKRRFNVSDYIGQVLLSLKPTLKKTEHTIQVHCAEGLEIYSYPGALSQILTNFIMNSLMHAYDRGQRGSITIDVSVSGSSFILKYADDGKGIDATIIDRIFDPFFTTKRGQGGTGLGLNVVYNVVTQSLNGTVRATSKLGKGTLFTVLFPVDNQNGVRRSNKAIKT